MKLPFLSPHENLSVLLPILPSCPLLRSSAHQRKNLRSWRYIRRIKCERLDKSSGVDQLARISCVARESMSSLDHLQDRARIQCSLGVSGKNNSGKEKAILSVYGACKGRLVQRRRKSVKIANQLLAGKNSASTLCSN